MRIETLGTARIRHKDTGEFHEIDPDELEWDAVGGSERQMGPETEYAAEVHHPDLGELVWRLWEYPAGAENFQQHELNGHQLVQDFDISLVHERDDDPEDEDEDEETPSTAAAEIRQWFASNYEDPAQSLPYNSREGGFLWIRGGPYSALQAIEEQFGTTYPFALLEEVANDIIDDAGGLDEWSPIDDPDRDDFDDEPHEATPLDQRRYIAARISETARELRTMLTPLTDIETGLHAPNHDALPGPGHNQPPGPIEETGLPKAFFHELDLATERVSAGVARLDDLIESEFAGRPEADPQEALLQAIRDNTVAVNENIAVVRENSRLIAENSDRLNSAITRLTAGGAVVAGISLVGQGALTRIGEGLVEHGATLLAPIGTSASDYLGLIVSKATQLAELAMHYIGMLPTGF